jgi:hypothetical protein
MDLAIDRAEDELAVDDRRGGERAVEQLSAPSTCRPTVAFQKTWSVRGSAQLTTSPWTA